MAKAWLTRGNGVSPGSGAAAGVSAVDDADTSVIVRDLDEKGGGEALHRPLWRKDGVVTNTAGVQPAGDVDHVLLAVGRLPESVDDRRGRPHCRRPLPRTSPMSSLTP